MEAAESAILAFYPGARVVSVLDRVSGVPVSAGELLGYLHMVKRCIPHSFLAFLEAEKILDGVVQFLISAGIVGEDEFRVLYEADRKAGYNLPH